MGLLDRISSALGSTPLNEDDVTVEIKDTDAEQAGAAAAVDTATDDAAEVTAPAAEDADTQVDVVNTADKPIVPVSGDDAAPDAETSNAEVQSEVEEEEEATEGENGDGPEDVATAFGAEDPGVKVEEEEDPGAVHNQELDDPTDGATKVATDGAQAAVAFSNVGQNELTKGDAENTDSDAVTEGYEGFEDNELDVVD